MNSLLLAWKLDTAKVLVVGAGTVAQGKVEVMRGTGADVVVVGTDPTPGSPNWRPPVRCVSSSDGFAAAM